MYDLKKYFKLGITAVLFFFTVWFIIIFPGISYWSRLFSSPDFFSGGILVALIAIILPIFLVFAMNIFYSKTQIGSNVRVGKGMIYGSLISIIIFLSLLFFKSSPDFGGMYYIILVIFSLVYLIIGLVYYYIGRKEFSKIK